jgi:[acyl-carrier-protein] S-malonyltransferase
MGKAWAEASPAAHALFDEAERILELPLRRICFEDPHGELGRTDVAQAALYVVSVASWRGLEAHGAAGPLTALGGLSLGEFTALHLAGAFDFAAGLRLVRLRGQAMQEAAEANPSGMVAIAGLEAEDAEAFCERVPREDEVLVPANFNSPGQVVVSGSLSACERAEEQAGQEGLKPSRLDVAGAFHSPLMASAADRLREALAQTPLQAPEAPVTSNVTGGVHEPDPDAIRERLVQQLTNPVRWMENAQWLRQRAGDTDTLWELAPGKVLSGLMRRIDRRARVQRAAAPEDAQVGESA